MKNRIVVRSWLVLLMVCAVLRGAEQLELKNSGFEAEGESWIIKDQGKYSQILPEAAYRSKFGLRIIDKDTKEGADVFSAVVPIQENRIYQLRFMARTADKSDAVRIHWDFFDKKMNLLTRYGFDGEIIYPLDATKDWREYRTQAMPPKGSAFYQLRIHSVSTLIGDADLDNFRLFVLNDKEAKKVLDDKDVLIQDNPRGRVMPNQLPLKIEELKPEFEKVAVLAHPRLFATAEEFEQLKQLAAGKGIHRQFRDKLCQLSDSLLPVPVLERVFDESHVRILDVSRRAVYRISTLALSYKLTGRAEYRERCVSEMRQIANFVDWNPRHYLDTGEMTLAMATGYDWLYDELSEEDRKLFADAILAKGIMSSGQSAWWRVATNNWGQVCHTGMLAGAVAIAEKDFDNCLEMAWQNIARMAIPMAAYNPSGNYPEGPGYWEYGTGFNVIGLSIMKRAFGHDFGLSALPGFKETGSYYDYMTGPSGVVYNYADGGAGGRSTLGGVWWFAKNFDQPELVETFDRAWLENYCKSAKPPRPEGNIRWYHAYAFFWVFDRPNGEIPRDRRPLVWHGQGPVPVVTMRNIWNTDEMTYVGLKGGSPSGPHGHMDGGSFILDAGKVRWAGELGAESYSRIEKMGLKLWDTRQNSDRWKLFRLNNFSHNTLTIDGHLQIVGGNAKFVEISQEPARVVMDLTSLYAEDCATAKRTVELSPEGVMTMTDELAGLKPGVQVVWGYSTTQKLAGQDAASVTLANKDLRMVTTSLTGGEWRVVEVEKPQPEFVGNGLNRNWRRVELVSTVPENGTLTIKVSMGLKK